MLIFLISKCICRYTNIEMDKSWMDLNNRQHPKYIIGVDDFLDFAFFHAVREDKFFSPCYKCVTGAFQTQ